MNPPLNCSFPKVVLVMKAQLRSEFFFLNAIILMSWMIWGARNDIIFNGRQPSINNCKRMFLDELNLTSLCVKVSAAPAFDTWIQSLL